MTERINLVLSENNVNNVRIKEFEDDNKKSLNELESRSNIIKNNTITINNLTNDVNELKNKNELLIADL